jgi:NAD(P)H dehydrogenase (quinone)
MKKKTLILGATGKVGSETLRLLRGSSTIIPIAAVRKSEQIYQFTDSGIEAREVDLDREETLRRSLNEIDQALLLTGYSVDMLKQSKQFIDAALQAGVKHIVHLGASASPTNDVAHWGWHRFVEAYIENTGMNWTHLHPEAYMQNITGPGYRWLNNDIITHYIGNARWTWVDCIDVAAVAAKVLEESDIYRSQSIRLGYASATMDEVAEILTNVSGRRIRAEAHPPEEFLNAAIESGADVAYMKCVYAQFKLDAQGLIPGAGEIFENFENIVGRAPTSWSSFALREKELI